MPAFGGDTNLCRYQHWIAKAAPVALLDAHDAVVRSQLARFRGREVNRTGDGFLAMFDGPQRAIRCATAIRDAVAVLGTALGEGHLRILKRFADRILLVLDGVEPLQQPPGGFGGEFKAPAMKALLRGLARHNPGLCIITSRTDITDLGPYEHRDGSCLRHSLDSLDPVAARALLRELGVLGPDRELDEAAECFHCHAYDLNLLGNYLAKCTPDREIRGWQQRFPVLKEDERVHPRPDAAGKRAGHGRRMLRAYERWLEPPVSSRTWLPAWLGGRKPRRSPALAVLRLLGLFDRPARSDLLDELRAAPVIPGLTEALVNLPQDDWLRALDQLQGLALIHREPLSMPAEGPRRAVTFALDTHPLLREHFGAELRAQNEAGRREGHRRLYAYLCATTKDKPDATLEDLQPLYQAVAHGCQAGLQCRQRPAGVPLSPVSPGTRDPPGGAETDLRAARWREGGVGHLPRPWRQRGAERSLPDRLVMLRNCSACSLSPRG